MASHIIGNETVLLGEGSHLTSPRLGCASMPVREYHGETFPVVFVIEVDAVEPVIAKTPVKSEAIQVEPGQAAGLRQSSRGIMGGREVITLDFQAYIGTGEEYDAISIEGVPSLHMKIVPCVQGDIGTVAIIVNSIPKVLKAPSGLVTMKDLPIPSAVLKDMRKFIHQ